MEKSMKRVICEWKFPFFFSTKSDIFDFARFLSTFQSSSLIYGDFLLSYPHKNLERLFLDQMACFQGAFGKIPPISISPLKVGHP